VGPRVTLNRRFSPIDHIMAVVDDPSAAPSIIAALGPVGIEANAVTLLRGPEGAARIDATGEATGLSARLRQMMSFTLADQMPDFILYEAALRDGRAVLAVPVTSDEMKKAVCEILRDHGAHFTNFFGRFVTEELDQWIGPELEIPDVLRR
jgi:hypothetical protein